jgi:glutathione S-transferase
MTLSQNCVGPAMVAAYAGAGGLEMCNMMDGSHKKEPFISVNPYGQCPGMTDGDLNIGQSNTILRYLALKYSPKLYPTDKPDTCAQIDWAMDCFVDYVYPSHTNVVYAILGFRPQPEDKAAAAKAYAEALDKWAGIFLKGKFVGGDELSIADFKCAAFFFPACEPAVEKLQEFTPPPRIKKYVSDFMAAAGPAAGMLTTAGGYSLREFLAAKLN